MSAPRLIFLGPPGSGKGTQAQRLVERRGLVQLSSGDVLRRERQEGTPVGRRAAEYMDAGKLVPDEVITDVMLAAVDRLPRDAGFILDGFPRTAPQAEALDRGLRERDMAVDAVIDFKLDDEEIIRRIAGRRVCKQCAATYNVSFLPPRVDGRCDKCGGELFQRPDDRREVVLTRLETYRTQTAPLIDYYARRGCFHTVDSAAGADAVEAAVRRVVDALGSR
ncbi:MAG: adenylate kinase [Planctomycetota bacterium]